MKTKLHAFKQSLKNQFQISASVDCHLSFPYEPASLHLRAGWGGTAVKEMQLRRKRGFKWYMSLNRQHSKKGNFVFSNAAGVSGIRDFGRAGHFLYFLIFSILKNEFLHFNRVNKLFLHQSYLKSPLPVKLTW